MKGLTLGGETVPGDSWATSVETSHLCMLNCDLDDVLTMSASWWCLPAPVWRTLLSSLGLCPGLSQTQQQDDPRALEGTFTLFEENWMDIIGHTPPFHSSQANIRLSLSLAN